jgi:hypothetical protein
MSEQSQLNALATDIAGIATALTEATTEIEAEIAALVAANPNLDFTALNAAVASLGTVATQIEAIPPAIVPPVQAFDPVSGLALYTYDGPQPVPGAPWVQVTDVTGPAAELLYTNTSDVAGAPPAFVVAGVWDAFTGTPITAQPTA